MRVSSLPPLYNCITGTVDMLVNIVCHNIDGNYESRKYIYMGEKIAIHISYPYALSF